MSLPGYERYILMRENMTFFPAEKGQSSGFSCSLHDHLTESVSELEKENFLDSWFLVSWCTVCNLFMQRFGPTEAWTDATQARRGSTPVLSPVKPPSRRDHRRHSSSDDISPRDTEAPVSLTTSE